MLCKFERIVSHGHMVLSVDETGFPQSENKQSEESSDDIVQHNTKTAMNMFIEKADRRRFCHVEDAEEDKSHTFGKKR